MNIEEDSAFFFETHYHFGRKINDCLMRESLLSTEDGLSPAINVYLNWVEDSLIF